MSRPTQTELLIKCEMHLTEIAAILSGRQSERNPTGLILNKSLQLLKLLQES